VVGLERCAARGFMSTKVEYMTSSYKGQILFIAVRPTCAAACYNAIRFFICFYHFLAGFCSVLLVLLGFTRFSWFHLVSNCCSYLIFVQILKLFVFKICFSSFEFLLSFVEI
jgi:hypothetical protein